MFPTEGEKEYNPDARVKVTIAVYTSKRMVSLEREQRVGLRLVEREPPRRMKTVVVPYDAKSVQNVMTEAALVAGSLDGMAGLDS